jgi:hypothetical protein
VTQTIDRHEMTPLPGGPSREVATATPPPSFLTEARNSISARNLILVVGVLLLQLGFVLSYVGAFHAPKPQHVPIAIVAPAPVSSPLVAKLNGLPDGPLLAQPVNDEAAARHLITTGQISAALVVNGRGTTDTLLVASGGGPAVATATETVAAHIEISQHRSLTVDDIVPLQAGDGHGLTGFYLVLGWLIGGYLVGSALGIANGPRPANTRRSVIRLLALVLYAVLSGLGGALIVDHFLGALTGHFLALWLVGALLVYAAGAVTVALQSLFGILGIAITILLFVVLGNPSAGGPYQASLLPPFWRALNGALLNGNGVDTVRRLVYFGGYGITRDLLVMAAYAVGGTVVAVTASIVRNRQHRAPSSSHV